MNNLKLGDFKDIPGLNKYITTLEESQSKEIISIFVSIESWEILEIKKIQKNVNVSIKLKMSDDYKNLNLTFTKSGKKWIPLEDLSFSQNIDYIPLDVGTEG
ncbi:MAG: hypothetical protein OCD02_18420 [Spirochaetaceae bacterium]